MRMAHFLDMATCNRLLIHSFSIQNDYIVYYEIIVLSMKIAIVVFMKKEVVITARITPRDKGYHPGSADKDERTLAWMVRKLLLEALEARGLLKKLKQSK